MAFTLWPSITDGRTVREGIEAVWEGPREGSRVRVDGFRGDEGDEQQREKSESHAIYGIMEI
jgi:hypothetical protein